MLAEEWRSGSALCCSCEEPSRHGEELGKLASRGWALCPHPLLLISLDFNHLTPSSLLSESWQSAIFNLNLSVSTMGTLVWRDTDLHQKPPVPTASPQCLWRLTYMDEHCSCACPSVVVICWLSKGTSLLPTVWGWKSRNKTLLRWLGKRSVRKGQEGR